MNTNELSCEDCLRKFSKNLGILLQAEQSKTKKTKAEIAEEIGISFNTLQSYTSETNRKYPSLQNLLAMSKYFEVSIDWLCGISTKRTPDITIHSDEDVLCIISELITRKYIYNIDADSSAILCNYKAVFGRHLVVDAFFERIKDILPLWLNGKFNDNIFHMILKQSAADAITDAEEVPF